MARKRGNRRVWTRRRQRAVAGLVFLLLALTTATQSASAAELAPGRSPFSLGLHVLSSMFDGARRALLGGSARLPAQGSGSGAGGAHDTRARVGSGHAPGAGAGQMPSAATAAARVPAGRSAVAHRGFDAATSKRLPARSSAYATWWQNADGTQTEQIAQTVVNYRDAAGEWQPIDTTLTRAPGGGWGVTAAGYGLSLAPRSGTASATAALATLTAGAGESVSWSLSGAAAVPATQSGDTATYRSILPGTDLALAAAPSGVKESLVLHSAAAPNTWTFPLTLTGLTLRQTPAGAWQLVDASGAVAATLAAPYALDSSHTRAAQTSDVSYGLATVGGVEELTMTLSAAWLRDPARAFPVTVDPTITVSTAGSGLSTYVDSTNATTNYSAAGVLDVGDSGSSEDYAYINFPSSVISSDLQHTGYHITSAQLAAYMSAGSTSSSAPFDVYSVAEPWTASSFTYAKDTFSLYQKLGTYAGSASAAATCSGLAGGNWLYTTLSAADMETFALGQYQWDGLMLAADDPTSTAGYRVFGSATNGACSPYLSLTYTADATPTVSTMSPASGTVLQTLTPQLTASGTDPDAWPDASVSYEFEVYDSAGSKPIATSPVLSTGSWTVPKDTLKWGQTYQWTVCVWDGFACAPQTFDSFQTNTPGPALTQTLSQSSSGHGFDVATGNYTTSSQDAAIAGVGPTLTVERDYNSLDTRKSNAFGQGWSSMVDASASMELDAAGNLLGVAVRYPDGSVGVYGYNPSDGSYAPPEGQYATLLPITSGGAVVGYRLTDKSGTAYTFGHVTTAAVAGSGTGVYTTAGVYGISQVADAAKHADTFIWGVVNGVSGTHVLQEANAVTGRALYFTWSTPTGAADPHVTAVTTSYAVSGNAATAQYWGYTYSGDELARVYAPDPTTPGSPPGSSSPYTGYSYQAGSDYQQAVLDTSPYQYWPMDDATGNSSSLTLAGQNIGAGRAYYTNMTGDTSYPDGPMATEGSTATGAVFNGTSSFMTLPTGMELNSAYMSVGLWFKTTAPGPLLCEQNTAITTTSTQQACPLYVGTDGKLHGAWYIGSTTSIISSKVVDDGAWHYAMLSGQGSTQTLYLDGASAGTLSGTINNLAMTYEYAGAGYNAGNWPNTPTKAGVWYLKGSISDVALYRTAVSATEAAGLYQAANTSAAWLTAITRPRAVSQNPAEAPAATIAYDTLDGRVASVTDGNGATWTLGDPTVTGSSQVFRQAVLADQPTYYYRLGDAAGSGYAADEVNTDAWANADLSATYNSVTLGTAKNVFGDGYAAGFDGANSSVALPSGLMAGAPVSIALWFNTAKGGSGPLWSEQNAGLGQTPTQSAIDLYVGTNGILYGSLPMGSVAPLASKDRVDDGAWHYAVLTASATGESLYLDGALAGTRTGTYAYSGQDEDFLGAGYSPGGGQDLGAKGTWHFTGSISDAAYFHSQLSQDQAAQLWQGYHNTIGSLVPLESVTVTDPADSSDGATHTETYEYDPAHELRKVAYIDPLGHETTYSYDTKGWEDVVTDPNGDETITGHDVRGNAVSTTTCQYQATNQCSTSYKTYYPDDTTTAFTSTTLDPRDDQLLTASDGRSSSSGDTRYRTTYTYDGYADLLTETNPAGHGVTNVYTTATSQYACNPADTTSPVLSTTQYAPVDLLSSSTTSGGAVTAYAYYPDGDTCLVVNPDHLQTFFTYDGLGRVLTKTVSGGVSVLPGMVGYTGSLTTAYAYDGDGRVVQTTAPSTTDRVTGAVHTAVTTNTYDADGDILSTAVADTTGGDYSRTDTYVYDNYDRKQSQTTANGNPSTNDAGGSLPATAGHTATYTYDAWGNVKTQSDELTGTATRTVETLRDADDRPVATKLLNAASDGTYAAGQTLTTDTKAYDAAGRLSAETDAMQNSTCYYYYDDNLTYQEVKTSSSCPKTALSSGAGDVTDTQVISTSSYDGAGNAVKNVTDNGVTTAVTVYNADGTVASATLDPSGVNRTTGYTYTPDGFVAETVSTTDANGVEAVVSDTKKTFDPLGDVMTSTVVDGSNSYTTTYTLDQRGLATQAQDPDGNVTAETYDEGGRLVETASPSIPVTLWCQTATSYPVCTAAGTAVTTTSVAITTIGYDTFGEQVETESPDSPDAGSAAPGATTYSTVAAYDAEGNKTSVTLPSYTAPGASSPTTSTTTYQYDADGELKTEYDPIAVASGGTAGQQTTYTYTMLGGVATQTNTDLADNTAAQTGYTYYADGSAHTTTTPISAGRSATSAATYDYLGRTLTSSTTESDPTYAATGPTTYTATDTYGVGGWLATAQTPDGGTVSYGYDNAGEKTSSTDNLKQTTTYGYDGAGRLTTTTLPDSSSSQTVYDEAGNKASTATYSATGVQLSGATAVYDGDGLLKSSTAQQPNQTSYNAADTETTTYSYDPTGMLTREVAPLTGSTTVPVEFTYDPAGKQTGYTDGNGNTTYTTYNSWNLPERTVQPATAADTTLASRTTTTTYDADGRATLVAEPVAGPSSTPVTIATVYDGFGDVLSETGAGAEGGTTSRTFSYDLTGLPLTATSQNGPGQNGSGGTSTSETFAYDDRGDLVSAAGGAGTSSFAYDGDGLMRSRTDASGTTTYGYNTDDQLTSLTDAATGTKLGYQYNSLGQVDQISYGGADTRTFGYDAAHRVKSDTLATSSGTTVSALTYSWDTDGNLLSKTDSAGTANTYSYDASGRLATWSNGTTQTAYSYDAASNRTGATATTIATGAVTSNQTFTYDARDELTGTTDAVTTASSTYTYTPRGTTAQVSTVSPTGATSSAAYADDAFGQQTAAGSAAYTYDALGRLTGQTAGTGSGTVTLQYSGTANDVASDGTDTYSRDPGGNLVGTADPAAGTSGLIWTDQHTDVVGEFASGGTALTGVEAYNPLGAVTADTGATAQISLGYQSGWTDRGNGHVNMAARWYNPATGQFTSADTVSNSAVPNTANANPFAYAAGNPLNATDPTGHFKFSEDDAASPIDAAELQAMQDRPYNSAGYWNVFHSIIRHDIAVAVQQQQEFDYWFKPVPYRYYNPDAVDVHGRNDDGSSIPLPTGVKEDWYDSRADYIASDDANEQALAAEHQGIVEFFDSIASGAAGVVAGAACSVIPGVGPFIAGACAGAVGSLTQKALECSQGYDTTCSVASFLSSAGMGAAVGEVFSLASMGATKVVGSVLGKLGKLGNLSGEDASGLIGAESDTAALFTSEAVSIDAASEAGIGDLQSALDEGPPARDTGDPTKSTKTNGKGGGSTSNTAPAVEQNQATLTEEANGQVLAEKAPPAAEAAPPKVSAPSETAPAPQTPAQASESGSGGGGPRATSAPSADATAARNFNIQYAKLPNNRVGETDLRTGVITITRGLSRKDFEETLRHEMVHSFLTPKNPFLISARIWLYVNSDLWRYSEEAAAETFATRSLSQGLKFPIVQDYGLTPWQSGAELAGLGAAAGGTAYGLYQASQ